MHKGKYLQLYRNSAKVEGLDAAVTTMIKQSGDLKDGSPIIVRYTDTDTDTDTDEEHALFGVRGADKSIKYVELSTGERAITNKRLKDLAKSLVNSISGQTVDEGSTAAYVKVTNTTGESGVLTYSIELVNGASTKDVQDVAEKVNNIAVGDKVEGDTSYSYTITLPDGSKKEIVIDKDNSLENVELGTLNGETFTPDNNGQVIRFTYSLVNGTSKTVDIDLGKAVFDFELSSIVNEALEYTTDGVINVKYDGNTIKLNASNQLYVDTTVIDNAIASADSATRTAITSEIDTAIKDLDVNEVKEEGKVIIAISQEDGKVSATLSQVEAKYVNLEKKDTESQLKSTDVNAAILELEDTISLMAAKAFDIYAGQGISIAPKDEQSSTQVISTKVAGDLSYDVDGAIKITVAESTTNGAIKVNDNDIKVAGLGTAAYTDSTAYDAVGTAQGLINDLDATVFNTPAEGDIVKVEVVQVDGKITAVNVTEGDIWNCGVF